MVDFVKVNGMVGYCIEADTKADAIKILELQKRIKELEIENDDFYEKVDSLKAENANLGKQIGSLKGENDDLRGQIYSFEDEITYLRERIDSLEAENDDLFDQNHEMFPIWYKYTKLHLDTL